MAIKVKKSDLVVVFTILMAIIVSLTVGFNGCSDIAATGSGVDSSAVTTTADPELTGTVVIDGTAQTGVTLAANPSGDTAASPVYQWQQDSNGNDAFVNIAGATAVTYLLTDDNVGNKIKVTVTRTGYTGSIASDPTAKVVDDGDVGDDPGSDDTGGVDDDNTGGGDTGPTVSAVTVSPSTAGVAKGGAPKAFTASVTGTGSPAQTVTWSIDEPHASGTVFTGNTLTVAANETAATLTIRATSTADTGKSGTAAVNTSNVIDLAGLTDAYAIREKIRDEGYKASGTGSDLRVLRVANLDLSNADRLRALYQGAAAAIPGGGYPNYTPYISLDLSQCSALTGTMTGMDNSTLDLEIRRRFGAIILPAAVRTLATVRGEDGTFSGFKYLTDITAPEVTAVGNYAFYGCQTLATASLPKATSIGTQAFCSCTSLTEVILAAATSLGDHAFYSCTSLTEVKLGATPPTFEDSAANIFGFTRGEYAPYNAPPYSNRTITIKFPTASPNTGWVAANSSKWGAPANLPDGRIVQGTY
jgi:hypothetical protein